MENDDTPLSTAMFEHFNAQWEYNDAKTKFMAALAALGLKEFTGIRGDDYDCSIELDGVGNDVRLTEDQQRVFFEAKFARAYINHKDGWETHYSWGAEFKPARGWRRRWVNDPNVNTTRSVGLAPGPDNAGYYEISAWPDGWKGHESWLDTGYMRIVPDPLEAK